MKKYTIVIRVSDPADDERFVEATFRDCPRETVINTPVIQNVVETFEESLIS